ncbi:MAG: M50 family metallopeptidase [Micromonosporaceae bacterium]
MAYALGVLLFALGIVISLAIHEAGHMWSARAFGMKVTKYFIGFGPTLWSFRRGETEYGVKPIPAGAFVKIIGMTPLEDEEDVAPADKHRVFWRKPLWQRTIVLSAGSISHFILGFLILWFAAVFVGVPNSPASATPASRVEVGRIESCVVTEWQYDAKARWLRECKASDPESPAAAAGLRPGDVITKIDGESLKSWDSLVKRVRDSGGEKLTLTYQRDGVSKDATVTLPVAERPTLKVQTTDKDPADYTGKDLEKVGVIGVGLADSVTVGPIDGIGVAGQYVGDMFIGTFKALAKFPEKVPKLFDALMGEERDPETPISVVGASRLGGEIVEYEVWPLFFMLLAVLNLFVGVFNLFPLLPLDGGHIAIAWYEKVRSWAYARLGRPDPGRVDYMKLMPLTYAVIIIFGLFTVLTVAADIVNPIELFTR